MKTNKFKLFLIFSSALLLAGIFILLQTSPKNRPSLTPKQRAMADSIRSTYYEKDCCSSTLAKCVSEKKLCVLATHLDTFLTWVAGIESTSTQITEQMDKRYKTLTSDSIVRIDTAGLLAGGNPSSPISVVLYVSALCPLCKYVSSELYNAVTIGSLNGKAKLIIKPYGLTIGDMAIMAAMEQKKLWEYILALKDRKERLDEAGYIRIADSLALDMPAFKKQIHDPKLATLLATSKKEGFDNGVTTTPGIFINNHPYHSYKDPQWVTDACLYEFERKFTKK
jgi:protein-disulfide isomerase